MLNKLILAIAFWTATSLASGQAFYDSLSAEANRHYDCPFDSSDLDSLHKAFFGSGKVKMHIDVSATYQVLFTVSESWCNGPHCPENFQDSNALAAPRVKGFFLGKYFFMAPKKRYYACAKTYKGRWLKRKSDISLKDSVFHGFPVIENNDDKYNGEWTVFSNDEYLVFRHVSIYIGNTSRYWEKRIYLRRID